MDGWIGEAAISSERNVVDDSNSAGRGSQTKS